jgi:TctA family transporter
VSPTDAQPQAADDDRDETIDETLDRNTIELLNELRIAATGIQVMFAFLLVVPFNTGWKKTTSFERTDYFVTLALVATAAFLLMAPPIQHRLLFRHHEKRYLVTMGNRLAIAGIGFLALGFTGILVLLSAYVVGGLAPVIVGVLTFAFVGGLWFGVPLVRRAHERAQ